MKEIVNKKNHYFHGYQEWYLNDELWLRVVYKHDEPVGYEDDHRKKIANFYIR
jgi:hypothetical protein